MITEEKTTPPALAERGRRDSQQQRENVHVSPLTAALVAEQPELSTLYNTGDLDRLAKEFAARLVSAARLGAVERGM